MSRKRYLGDGAYVELDDYGRGLKLTAEDGWSATDTIFLDAVAWDALVRYVEEVKKRKESTDTESEGR